MKTRFPVYATLLTILGISILCGLGFWQLERLEWKTNVLRELDAAYNLGERDSTFNPSELKENFMFRRRTLRGVYDYAKEIRLGPRVHDGLPGFHVLTPLRLEDGSYIFVNRGWVPNEWTFESETRAAPGTMVSIMGLLRKPGDRNPFTPANRPGKNEWYYPDTAEISAAGNLPGASSYILYLESPENTKTAYPLAQATRPALNNNHLQYALFWFTMAGILCVIYALRFLRTDNA